MQFDKAPALAASLQALGGKCFHPDTPKKPVDSEGWQGILSAENDMLLVRHGQGLVLQLPCAGSTTKSNTDIGWEKRLCCTLQNADPNASTDIQSVWSGAALCKGHEESGCTDKDVMIDNLVEDVWNQSKGQRSGHVKTMEIDSNQRKSRAKASRSSGNKGLVHRVGSTSFRTLTKTSRGHIESPASSQLERQARTPSQGIYSSSRGRSSSVPSPKTRTVTEESRKHLSEELFVELE